VAVSILKQRDYLIATIQAALDDRALSDLEHALLEGVGRSRARGIIIDVAGLDVIDSFATRTLRDLAHAVRLCGAETVIVGMQPEVAVGVVQLGLPLGSVATALDLEEGLALLDQALQGNARPG